jgi:putative two-component system response regulator
MQTTLNLTRTLDEIVSAAGEDAARSVPAFSGLTDPPEIKQAHVMVVDDEPLCLAVVQGYLEMDGFRRISTVDDGTKVMSMLRSEVPDALLLDIQMPRVNGLDLLSAVRAADQFQTLPVLILSASSDSKTKLRAFELGATDMLTKPVHQAELLARLRNVLRLKAYHDRLLHHSKRLEEEARKRTTELEISRLEVIQCLARAAEIRDDDTGRHVLRVGCYARLIGDELGFSAQVLDTLELAAQLHDVGKIGVPDDILLKPDKLSPEEFEIIQKHCGFGKKIVEPMLGSEATVFRDHAELGVKIMSVGHSPILEVAKRIALTHHERWDGTGYPLGLAREDIPIEGRITAVADVFDALSNKRPYKPAFPMDKCLKIMEQERGKHFDPQVLGAFFARRADVVEVQICYAKVD